VLKIRAIISQAVAGFARDQIRPVIVAVALWTIAALLMLVVIGFMVAGIYVAIEAPLGPIAASFIMAGIVLILAAILILLANRQVSRAGRPAAPAATESTEPPTDGIASVSAAFAFGLAKGLGRRKKNQSS